MSQPKYPISFECDTSRIPYGDDGWKTIQTGIKTITKSERQIWLGEYIYF